MKNQAFLQGTQRHLEIAVSIRDVSVPEEDSEVIKICVIGSQRGIQSIIHSLHVKGFAIANDWSKPQPTGKFGEFISVLFRRVFFS